jgi:hypothetical protein
MTRIERVAVAAIVLVAFVTDLRFVIPVVAALLAVRAWQSSTWFEAGIGVALLVASSLSFLFGNEVAAWALALAVAVLAGVSAARPTARERRVGAR